LLVGRDYSTYHKKRKELMIPGVSDGIGCLARARRRTSGGTDHTRAV
jgi:hypothetical protein